MGSKVLGTVQAASVDGHVYATIYETENGGRRISISFYSRSIDGALKENTLDGSVENFRRLTDMLPEILRQAKVNG